MSLMQQAGSGAILVACVALRMTLQAGDYRIPDCGPWAGQPIGTWTMCQQLTTYPGQDKPPEIKRYRTMLLGFRGRATHSKRQTTEWTTWGEVDGDGTYLGRLMR